MIELKGVSLDQTTFSQEMLTYKRDLIWYDGPLLSEFSDKDGGIVLKYWCDCNDFVRSMFFKMENKDFEDLISRKETLLFSILNSVGNSVIFIDEDCTTAIYYEVAKENIPWIYLPDVDSYLDVEEFFPPEERC